ncbi:MAG: class I SAM-dependent methyltransferase [Planctomycetes bacterium]|nr:class I SAM-dependent methyltransferase [Planctomycetota bacterium]MBI3833426.1 class I SAM-dependent methyltransferase [Planctomycetota bacterium]
MATIWDLRASLYDVCEASDFRRGPQKTRLFREMRGRVLFVGVGTGIDIKHFPPGHSIAAIDISDKMLRKAEKRAAQYCGNLVLCRADAQNLKFPSASFDTVVTSCTMCSVPDPFRAFREFHRILRPGGRLLMFEHVRSRNPLLAIALDLMTLWTRLSGTEMNRDTLATARAAGFEIIRIETVYLDIILAVHALKLNPASCTAE